MITVEGIDVSSHQRTVTWEAEYARGVRFAYVRVADGVSHLDEKYAEHAAGARVAGILTGAYLFFRATRPAEEQAALLVSQAQHFRGMPPCLDFEERSDMGLPRAEVRRVANACIAEVEKLAGRCVVYTCASWWDSWMGEKQRDLDLWVANYGRETPLLPRAWHKAGYVIHQYEGTGKCDGIVGPCDRNRFQGDLQALHKWAKGEC
jgi:lysozyme